LQYSFTFFEKVRAVKGEKSGDSIFGVLVKTE